MLNLYKGYKKNKGGEIMKWKTFFIIGTTLVFLTKVSLTEMYEYDPKITMGMYRETRGSNSQRPSSGEGWIWMGTTRQTVLCTPEGHKIVDKTETHWDGPLSQALIREEFQKILKSTVKFEPIETTGAIIRWDWVPKASLYVKITDSQGNTIITGDIRANDYALCEFKYEPHKPLSPGIYNFSVSIDGKHWVELLKFTKLDKPNPTAEVTGSSITLIWDPVNGAINYEIYLKKDDNWEFLEKTNQTTYSFDISKYGITEGTCTIKIKAIGDENTIPSEQTFEIQLKPSTPEETVTSM